MPDPPARSDARAAHVAGTEHLLAGRVLDAVRALREAVRLDPGLRDAHYNLAVALKTHGDLDAALAHAERALALGPPFAAGHALCGALRQVRDERAAATAHFETALALDPGHRVARYYLAMALRLAGRTREAVVHLRAALADRPGAAPMPALLAERLRGQLHDALAAAAPDAPVAATQCGTAVVSEVLAAGAAGTPESLQTFSGQPARAAAAETCVTPAEAARVIASARTVVALTGAGISAASGLRTRKELWRVYDRDAAVSVWRFRDDPAVLWRVVRDFLGEQAHPPSAAHHALARLPNLAAVLTQNVDTLHQLADPGAAGARYPVIELHGTLAATRCNDCGADAGAPAEAFVRGDAPLPPRCAACGAGVLRPDVVLFGEWVAPARLAAARAWATRCDVMLVVGCAMDVAPASELPRLAAANGAAVIEVKRHPSRISGAVGARVVRGVADEVLPAIAAEIERASDAVRDGRREAT